MPDCSIKTSPRLEQVAGKQALCITPKKRNISQTESSVKLLVAFTKYNTVPFIVFGGNPVAYVRTREKMFGRQEVLLLLLKLNS